MTTLLWVVLGWFGMTVTTALGARVGLGPVMPDLTVITLVFLVMRRGPIQFGLAAFALGYIVGRQSLAPFGLHETALMLCGLCVYIIAGQLMSSGGWFFALTCGVVVMGYHLILFLLTYWVMGAAQFSNWAAALLLPTGMLTFAVAYMSYPIMMWIDSQFQHGRREELSWR